MTERDAPSGSPRVGIVGAGAAGVGAAYALRETDADVTILEKSGGVCGRAATRRKHGCRYDHGANYVNATDDRTAELLEDLGRAGLAEIDEPVWTFDAEGTITAGDGRDSKKYTWTEGITQLAKRLLDRTDATVHRRTRVAEIRRDDAGRRPWALVDADGVSHGPFDALLLTPPAPQTAALLRAAAWDDHRREALVDAVESVSYRTIRTIILHYPFGESYPWYGLVNPDREHAIGWLSREECKPGHVPDGESVLVVQMSPEWSTKRYDDPLSAVVDDVADRVATLLDDERYRDPDWADDQGWRYALPDDAVETAPFGGSVGESAEERSLVEDVADAGLYVAGDWVAGEGRVPAALWNGYETGEWIGERVG
ncbi:NAD(P)/FAD-dependent oxidoreductase [Halobellus rufus]|uniref:NAD(P)/FAD-dependent oxidoreductase n=1 Tax=Halobellus rufus TaxID=1448860 RepID=UPI0006787D9D|nr:FAD-dependent oxidoreductase [Halobellus rufus]